MDGLPPGPGPSPGHLAFPPPPGGEPEPAGPPDEPERESREIAPWVGLGVVLLLLAAGVVGVTRFLATPERCADTNFTSSRFGFCLRAPKGWLTGSAEVDGEPVDEVLQPDGPATLMIQAVAMPRPLSADQFADAMRTLDGNAGLELGDVADERVGGMDALRWDLRSSEGPTVFVTRQVVFVTGDIGWRVRLTDTEVSFDEHVAQLRDVLDSWDFV